MPEKIYRPVCFGNKTIASKPYAKCRACPHFPCYICQRCGRDTRPMTLRARGDYTVVCLWCFGKLEKWNRAVRGRLVAWPQEETEKWKHRLRERK